MASGTPRLPEQFKADHAIPDFDVSELLSDAVGSHSPFGDTEFPLPLSMISYVHPTAADRPNLADGR